MNYFEDFHKIKYYIISMAVCFGIYAWASLSGTKIIGDDVDAKEESSNSHHGGHGVFFHK